MKYIVCETPGQFLLKEKNMPVANEGQVLLDIKKVGICGTDIHAYLGNQAYFTYPRILGHELAATIAEGTLNGKFSIGEKVILIPYLHCGKCIACRNGQTNCCTSMQVMGVHVDGGMQEKISVPESALIATPELSLEEMVIVEPLAIAKHAIRRANVQKDETVLVMGCGPIGLAIMVMAKIQGAKVLALDTNAKRLEFAKEKIGVAATILAGPNAKELVSDQSDKELCQVVFDATGSKIALEKGPDYMSHGGRYVLVGLSKGELVFSHPAIHAKESSILCSRNATREDFDEVIKLLAAKKFPTDAYITHQANFGEMIGSFDNWLLPENQVIKAVVSF
ncbi:zinc-binding alcohol dehydrogenase family protein [Anditalea andensis]|uniref:Alcohol dehydrogenase n=1 Tax=Anditalea andensis TaxID=1048983 RepID=A0A074L2Z4_9BACT|nr:zinc-binding alcohol dehydrogenase family protein [Anditalea andensis]KEO74238.1 alcohol dehydrogenase [Anditalea andensis]